MVGCSVCRLIDDLFVFWDEWLVRTTINRAIRVGAWVKTIAVTTTTDYPEHYSEFSRNFLSAVHFWPSKVNNDQTCGIYYLLLSCRARFNSAYSTKRTWCSKWVSKIPLKTFSRPCRRTSRPPYGPPPCPVSIDRFQLHYFYHEIISAIVWLLYLSSLLHSITVYGMFSSWR